MYQLTSGDCIKRLTDGAFIPLDPENFDFAQFTAWLKEGNTPDPDPTTASYTWDQVLQKRNQLLHDSDWTMIPGCTVDQHAWAVYRQVLRDLPQTFAGCNPLDVIWPEEPSTAGPNTRKEEEEVLVETPVNVVKEQDITLTEETSTEPADVKIESTEEG